MNILGICGSPKKKESTSKYLLEGLQSYLDKETPVNFFTLKEVLEKEDLVEYNILIVSFPLYVDGVPSHLLQWMREMEEKLRSLDASPTLYCIINLGFFEAIQGKHAVEIMRNWSNACNIPFGGAVVCGGGGMIQMAPIGHGPGKNFGIALDKLSKHIQKNKPIETQFLEPNFPRFLYKQAAHIGWKNQSKANGLTKKDIYARW